MSRPFPLYVLGIDRFPASASLDGYPYALTYENPEAWPKIAEGVDASVNGSEPKWKGAHWGQCRIIREKCFPPGSTASQIFHTLMYTHPESCGDCGVSFSDRLYQGSLSLIDVQSSKLSLLVVAPSASTPSSLRIIESTIPTLKDVLSRKSIRTQPPVYLWRKDHRRLHSRSGKCCAIGVRYGCATGFSAPWRDTGL